MTSSPFRMGHIYPSATQKPMEAAVPKDRATKLTEMMAEELADNVKLRDALRRFCDCVWNSDNNSHDVVNAARGAEELLTAIENRQ